MSSNSTIGQRIRELRLKKGITQMDLAKGLVTPSMISQVESDKARPSYNVLFAIAERLEVPLETLLSDVDLNLEHTSKHRMAVAMCNSKQYSVAIPLLEELLNMNDLYTPISKIDLMFDLGICYLGVGNEEESLKYFEQVFEWAMYHKKHEVLSKTLINMGLLAIQKKDYQVALYHTKRALNEYDKLEVDDPMMRVKILAQIAEVYKMMGKVDDAAKFHEKSLSNIDELIDPETRGNLYLSLAQTYYLRGQYDKVEEFATKATVLLEQVENKEKCRDWKCQLSLLKLNKLNWQQTVLELLNLATLYETKDKQVEAGQIYADVSAIYLNNDELEEAWALAEKAHLKLPHNHVAMGKVNRVLAFVYFRQGNQEKGYKYLENAVTIFEQHGRLADCEEVTLHMCHYLSEKGRHREAFERVEKLHDFMMKKLSDRGIVL